ncbi:hypothetical protein [Lancefieldella rimae]
MTFSRSESTTERRALAYQIHDVSDSCCHSKVQRILKGKTFVFSIGKSGYYGVFCTDGASHGYTREICITGLFFGDIDGALAIYGDIDRFKVAAYEPREFVVVGFWCSSASRQGWPEGNSHGSFAQLGYHLRYVDALAARVLADLSNAIDLFNGEMWDLNGLVEAGLEITV